MGVLEVAALEEWSEMGGREPYRQTFRQHVYQNGKLVSPTPRFSNTINLALPTDPSPQSYDLADL